METIDGKQVELSSLLKGKFSYIDVWATWCGPCCAEIPHLERLVEKYKDNDNVQFISISVDADRKAWENKLKKADKDRPYFKRNIIGAVIERDGEALPGATPYAEKALEINGNIDDRSSVVAMKDWYMPKQSPNNYVYFGIMAAPFAEVISMETAMMFEEGLCPKQCKSCMEPVVRNDVGRCCGQCAVLWGCGICQHIRYHQRQNVLHSCRMLYPHMTYRRRSCPREQGTPVSHTSRPIC